MAEHAHEHGHGHGHGHAHEHGTMDVAAHQRTFDGFIRFWVYLFGSAIAILIFLALFNS